MGLEILTQPQVFLAPISALGGIFGNPPPFYTSFYTWTTSTPTSTSIFFLDNPNVALLDIPSSYIVSVGGVVQSPTQYVVNPLDRSVNFTVPVIEDTIISVTQIGTVAVSTINVTGLTAKDSFFENVTAIDSLFSNSLFTNLTATNFTVLSSFAAVDVTQQTLTVSSASFDDVTTINLQANSIETQNILSFNGNFGGSNLFDQLTAQDITALGTANTNVVNVNTVQFDGTTQNIATSATNNHLRVIIGGETFYIRLFKQAAAHNHISAVKTTHTGNGTLTTFAINEAGSSSPNNYRVDLDGVLQEPGVNYSISGTNIVFAVAPPAGTKIVIVTV